MPLQRDARSKRYTPLSGQKLISWPSKSVRPGLSLSTRTSPERSASCLLGWRAGPLRSFQSSPSQLPAPAQLPTPFLQACPSDLFKCKPSSGSLCRDQKRVRQSPLSRHLAVASPGCWRLCCQHVPCLLLAVLTRNERRKWRENERETVWIVCCVLKFLRAASKTQVLRTCQNSPRGQRQRKKER